MLNFFWRMMRNRKGFTLVELMVVVVILGILASLAVQQFGSHFDSAKLAKVKADLKTIASAGEIYKIVKGSYPTSIDVLENEGYLKKKPLSPVDGTEYAWNTANNVAVLRKTSDGTTYVFGNFTCASDHL